MPEIPYPATARLVGQSVNCRFDGGTGLGTRPETLTLVAPAFAFDLVPGEVTDLTVRHDGEELVWRRVRISHVNEGQPTNAGLWEVKLEDRRWQWENAYVDGDYNRPHKDATLKREKTPRQIASLLFAAMGEPAVDVSALPNQARPRKVWIVASARDELDQLVSDYGCAVAFDGPTDRARIVRIGRGEPIVNPEAFGGRVSSSGGTPIPAWPKRIQVDTGPSLFQTELVCGEAVGEEIDGSIKPIDELSYRPVNGWGNVAQDGFDWLAGFYVRDGQRLLYRDLAEKSVYKWYRITGQAGSQQRINSAFAALAATGQLVPQDVLTWSPASLFGDSIAPRSKDDLGPFTGDRLQKDTATGNRLPLYVRGLYFQGDNANFGLLDYFLLNQQGRWPYGATINNETKVLQLERRAYQMNFIGAAFGVLPSYQILPAQLTVIAAYAVASDGVQVRYGRFRENQGPTYGFGTRLEVHEEISPEFVETSPDNFGVGDNLAAVTKEAEFYLGAIEASYEVRQAEQFELPGIHRLAPDGLLRHVRWGFGAEGPAPTTTVTYNQEEHPAQPDFRDTPAMRAKRVADAAARQRDALKQGRLQ